MNEAESENESERIFVVIGHRVRTDARFNLNDLCGSTGRLDILLRTINSGFLLSNGIRRNVRFYFVLQGDPEPPVTIRLMGNELKYLNPDERSTGALIRQALITMGKRGPREGHRKERAGIGKQKWERTGRQEREREGEQEHAGIGRQECEGEGEQKWEQRWIRSTPGIYVSKNGFTELMEYLKREGRIPVYLHETGDPVREMDDDLIEKAFFVLGDQFDLSEEEEGVLGGGGEGGTRKISLGPCILHTDHCVLLIHNALDLRTNG